MRLTAALTAFAVGIATALSPAVDTKITNLVTTIPECGFGCLLDAVTKHSTCSPIGYECQCSQPNHRRIKVATVPCVLQTNCTQAEQLQFHAITDEVCELVHGKPVPPATAALAQGSGASTLHADNAVKIAGLIFAAAAAAAWIR